jgi:hypothetical protein
MTSPGAPRRFPQALGCTNAATISYRCPATRTAVLRLSFWGSCRYVFKRKLPKVLPGEDRRKFEFDHCGTLRFLMPTALSGSPSERSSVSRTRRKPLATATLLYPIRGCSRCGAGGGSRRQTRRLEFPCKLGQFRVFRTPLGRAEAVGAESCAAVVGAQPIMAATAIAITQANNPCETRGF